MPIEFFCPQCNKQLRVPDHAAGKKAKCPSCEQVCKIPAAVASQVAQAAPQVAPTPTPGPASQPDAQPDHLRETNYFPNAAGGMPAAAPTSNPTGSSATENPFAAPNMAAGYNPPVPADQLQLASRGNRFLGRFIDNLLTGFVMFAVALVFGLLVGATDGDPSEGAIVIGAIVTYGSVLIVPIINWVMMVNSGQTIGKKIVGSRVVTEDTGQIPSFAQGVALRHWVFGVLGFVPLVNIVLGLTDACWIFGEKQQCLHDVLAKTRVVNAK